MGCVRLEPDLAAFYALLGPFLGILGLTRPCIGLSRPIYRHNVLLDQPAWLPRKEKYLLVCTRAAGLCRHGFTSISLFVVSGVSTA